MHTVRMCVHTRRSRPRCYGLVRGVRGGRQGSADVCATNKPCAMGVERSTSCTTTSARRTRACVGGRMRTRAGRRTRKYAADECANSEPACLVHRLAPDRRLASTMRPHAQNIANKSGFLRRCRWPVERRSSCCRVGHGQPRSRSKLRQTPENWRALATLSSRCARSLLEARAGTTFATKSRFVSSRRPAQPFRRLRSGSSLPPRPSQFCSVISTRRLCSSFQIQIPFQDKALSEFRSRRKTACQCQSERCNEPAVREFGGQFVRRVVVSRESLEHREEWRTNPIITVLTVRALSFTVRRLLSQQ